MPDILLEWRNYRYFPYEREFARLEANKLFATVGREEGKGIRLSVESFALDSAAKLTYFARVVHANGDVVVPRQAQLEASANAAASQRQATRYSAHALHEYKGRFNPQVVRAIGNIVGLSIDDWVLDPFCGSGTTLLESAHSAWNAVGVDRNPLAVRIANAKLHALRCSDGYLEEIATNIQNALADARVLSQEEAISAESIQRVLGDDWENDLPSRSYLEVWFARSVLAQLVAIRRAISVVAGGPKDRAVFDVVLSDQLRDVSLQEPADLRIRRRKDAKENYALIDMFGFAIAERLARVARARHAMGRVHGHQEATVADARSLSIADLGAANGPFDAIITSPPYETALPYIDTQRLSLVLLGDLSSSALASTERELIGARDIATRERAEFEVAIKAGDDSLPEEVIELCRELLSAAAQSSDGFRRMNRPALAFRYFKNMARVFASARKLVRSGAPTALVVGKNRTTLGGREFVIDTPCLLANVAKHIGYELVLEQSMETYQRYDLHHKNAIDAERLLVLAAP